uniref:Uncharacterized protein n=1 Tax=Aegilops tauschii subsp. strangulata TaxID=200361 RepID=A0A453HLD1_AEGTS
LCSSLFPSEPSEPSEFPRPEWANPARFSPSSTAAARFASSIRSRPLLLHAPSPEWKWWRVPPFLIGVLVSGFDVMQRKLPLEEVYIDVKDSADGWNAIRDMVVR